MMERQTFINKQVQFEAVQVHEFHIEETAEWCGAESWDDETITVHPAGSLSTLTKRRHAFIDDWIVTDGRVFEVYRDEEFKSMFDMKPSYADKKDNVTEMLHELIGKLQFKPDRVDLPKIVEDIARRISFL